MPLIIIIIIIINTIAFNYRSLYDTKRDDKVRLGLRSNAGGEFSAMVIFSALVICPAGGSKCGTILIQQCGVVSAK